jgi:DNA-directed RNA polymerase subunit RPC12/RpoP
MEDKVKARCVLCSNSFTESQLVGANACPSCGTRSLPMSPDDDVTLNINWHELRILAIWAENWARQCDAAAKDKPDHENMLLSVMTIAARLERQYPEKPKVTLFSEIRDLRTGLAKIGATVESDLDDDAKLGL